jgi:hypothetical protein
VVTSLIIFTGTILKVNHLAGAAIILTAGMVTLVLFFIPAALINHYKSQNSAKNTALHIVTWLTCFVVFTAMLFKILHWPYAGIILLVALPFPYIVFLPVFIFTTSKNKNSNIYDMVFVLSLLAFNSVFTSLLSLNVSKTRINDSLNLSRNYITLEKAMIQLPAGNHRTDLDLKIDEVLKIVHEYQEIILNSEGIFHDQWTSDPGIILRPESPAIAAEALLAKEGPQWGTRLEAGMKGLITQMEKTGGNLSKVAPLVLDFKTPPENESRWAEGIFKYNTLSWSLIYLDALKTNLLMLKSTGPAYN